MSIYEQLRKIINNNSCFGEYFEEEHNVKLYDAMTFKELLILCNQYNVGGRFK